MGCPLGQQAGVWEESSRFCSPGEEMDVGEVVGSMSSQKTGAGQVRDEVGRHSE